MPIEALSPYDVVVGFPLDCASGYGARGAGAPMGGRGGFGRVLGALESIVLEALSRPPCVVQFSGGRDSSVLLAVAARLARRHGLSPPVPLTVRFPGVAEAEEVYFQELVVRHLGLGEWERVDAGEDADLLGPPAQGVLLRHGVIWSPVLATRASLMALARGGSVLSGEGGDEVFGQRRSSPLAGLARAGGVSSVARLTSASLLESLPRRARSARLRRHFARHLGLEWLRPEVREDFLARLAAQWAAEPFLWRQALRWVTSRRHVRLGTANMAALAAEAGAFFEAPFLDPRFVVSLARVFRPLGPANRTEAMRSLFSSYLPEELLARPTKAVFTLPAWGRRTQEFVAGWAGEGVNPELVDVAALKRHWEMSRPSAMTFGLVQQAWLGQNRRTSSP